MPHSMHWLCYKAQCWQWIVVQVEAAISHTGSCAAYGMSMGMIYYPMCVALAAFQAVCFHDASKQCQWLLVCMLAAHHLPSVQQGAFASPGCFGTSLMHQLLLLRCFHVHLLLLQESWCMKDSFTVHPIQAVDIMFIAVSTHSWTIVACYAFG